MNADEIAHNAVLDAYRKERSDHFATCPDATVTWAEEGSYGCDTGCEVLWFTIECKHQKAETSSSFEWWDLITRALQDGGAS